MNHFSYPLTIVQINIFEEPQNIFPNQNPRPQTIEPVPPPPRIFNYEVPPGLKRHKILIILVAFAAQNLTTAGHVIWLFSDETVMNCSIQKVKLKH